jgi:glycosyltransferase involved in cell wall biosynthesis
VTETATAATPTESALDWLRCYELANGRKLRILHIGNIANNAYNNAKIQQRFGIDADVASYDYYHVMACPEWEDADFVGDLGDPFFPDWWSVSLAGFERPRWFAQGQLATCQRYLLARRRGKRLAGALLWRRLEAERRLLARPSGGPRIGKIVARGAARRARRNATRWKLRLRRRAFLVRRAASAAREGHLGTSITALASIARHARPDEVEDLLAQSAPSGESEVATRFRELFPSRHPLARADLAVYSESLPRWSELMQEYDIVQAYSVDPILPYLCGFERVAAYEHGTLRETPFEETTVGRLASLSYREAPVVFVTNTDVMPSVERLGIEPERVVRLPHAVDSERLFRFGAEHRDLGPPEGEVVFFSPTRQDWVDAHLSWTKGNDRAIRALALVRDRGYSCRLVLGEWGRDLEASRRLIDELGVETLVDWTPALRKAPLWSGYLSSHAVLDQFVLPAIGGVAFEAMALGRRVITALDLDATRAFFGEAPPVLACSLPEEIADAMIAVIEDPTDEAAVGVKARAWFERFHSSRRIVELQAEAYRRLLVAG